MKPAATIFHLDADGCICLKSLKDRQDIDDLL